MSQELQRTIDPNEQQLNNLFKEVLDGLRDDIVEAQLNVDRYLELINIQGGIEMFGAHYSQSLTIKGSARDRQLKFLNTFKERVTRKEEVELKKELKAQELGSGKKTAGNDIESMNKFLEEMAQSGKLPNVNLDFDVEDEEADDE